MFGSLVDPSVVDGWYIGHLEKLYVYFDAHAYESLPKRGQQTLMRCIKDLALIRPHIPLYRAHTIMDAVRGPDSSESFVNSEETLHVGKNPRKIKDFTGRDQIEDICFSIILSSIFFEW